MEPNNIEKQLQWFVDNPTVSASPAAALAGIAVLKAVREFDNSSGTLGRRMVWLTAVLRLLTVVLVVLTLMLAFRV